MRERERKSYIAPAKYTLSRFYTKQHNINNALSRERRRRSAKYGALWERTSRKVGHLQPEPRCCSSPATAALTKSRGNESGQSRDVANANEICSDFCHKSPGSSSFIIARGGRELVSGKTLGVRSLLFAPDQGNNAEPRCFIINRLGQFRPFWPF